MRKINLQQGTPEWLAFRKNKIGGSDIASIVECEGAYKSRKKLLEEKLGFENESNDFQEKIFQDGHEWEEIVRKSHFKEYEPCVIQSTRNESFIASLDGLFEDKILEIKSTSSTKILNEIKNGNVPVIYNVQIQWQLMVADLHLATLAVIEKNTGELFIFEIKRDDPLCEEIEEHALAFLKDMQKEIAPVQTLEIAEMQNLFEKKSAIKALQKRIDEIDEQIKSQAESLLKQYQATKLVGCGVTIEMLERKGSVDYSKIPELKDINLENYRKKSTNYVAIKEIK